MRARVPAPRLTLEAVSQVAAPQHPGVEAERVPVLRAEEALRRDLQRVQRQPAGALRVRPGLLEHHVRARRVQSPRAAPLEAGAEDPGGARGVQRLREAERRGPDGLVPGAAVAARLLPDQRLDGEALLVIAVLEHDEEDEEEISEASPGSPAQIPNFPRRAITPPESACASSRAQILEPAPGSGRTFLHTCPGRCPPSPLAAPLPPPVAGWKSNRLLQVSEQRGTRRASAGFGRTATGGRSPMGRCLLTAPV